MHCGRDRGPLWIDLGGDAEIAKHQWEQWRNRREWRERHERLASCQRKNQRRGIAPHRGDRNQRSIACGWKLGERLLRRWCFGKHVQIVERDCVKWFGLEW